MLISEFADVRAAVEVAVRHGVALTVETDAGGVTLAPSELRSAWDGMTLDTPFGVHGVAVVLIPGDGAPDALYIHGADVSKIPEAFHVWDASATEWAAVIELRDETPAAVALDALGILPVRRTVEGWIGVQR